RTFVYTPRDLRVFYLIRRLAALWIGRSDYQVSFGSDPLDDFSPEFEAIEREELITVTDEAIEPTDLGMFYADSIAAILAWKQHARGNRDNRMELGVLSQTRRNDNRFGHM